MEVALEREDVTPEVLRQLAASQLHLAPATRARKQATLCSFFTWATRSGFLDENPMDGMLRVRQPDPAPRHRRRDEVDAVLRAIPRHEKRDRLLFSLLAETGLRISEALALHVEDVSLTLDDERLSILGKGGRRRTVLLDHAPLVAQLKTYLRVTGYQSGLLFRAKCNGDGLPLRYQSIHERWLAYCAAAGIEMTIHQLRHTHGTELVNGGVSLATIRKRLGHKSIQTTLRYAQVSDDTADAELRAWRRRRR